jgi:hypothetical protein
MRHSHDLNLGQKLSVDDAKRKSVEDNTLGSVNVRRIEPWLFVYVVKSGKQFLENPSAARGLCRSYQAKAALISRFAAGWYFNDFKCAGGLLPAD